MSFFRTFLLICLFSTSVAISNEKIPVKYIDLNLVVNDSIVGKKIKSKIISEGEKLKNEHQKIEKKLQTKKK